MDADYIRSLTQSGAKVMIFSGANSGVMRSDIKSVDSMPSDEVLDERRRDLDSAIKHTRKGLLDTGMFPQDVGIITDPSNPFPKVVRDWWVRDETTKDIARFLCVCNLADGSEMGWSNGFLGSRWADTIINGLRLRIAFYSRSKDPKYFATIERQNCGITGKHQFLFIFNTLYFQEDETHHTLKFATRQEQVQYWAKLGQMCPKDAVWNRKLERMYERIVRLTQQTVLIHDDDEWFAKVKEDLANPFENCCFCGEKIEGYGNNPRPVKCEGHCCDDCNLSVVIPARFHADEGRNYHCIKMTKEVRERLERERDERERQAEVDAEKARKVAEENKRLQAKEAEERKKREKAEAKRLAEATRADREEVEAKKKAEALAKKTAEEEDRIKRMDEGQLKAILKTIPARPPKTIRDKAGCVKDNSQKQKQWDEKWGQYKKYLK